ncbi:hypothetical protein ACFU53_22420 [Streptomyces sp. NPDC057474]|uniref:hypothetical protein n=1 Tax=Streptomyces sp. NPDC057474 TaxID=3346144 RepID=UPI00369117D4
MESSSTWDDASILDEEVIYRRVPDVPNFLTADLISGDRKPSRAAFQFDSDGISIHRKALLDEHGLGPDSVIKKPGQMVFSFLAAVPRSHGVGIIYDPVDEPPAGFAHALIRGEKPRPDDKALRARVGDALAEASVRVY